VVQVVSAAHLELSDDLDRLDRDAALERFLHEIRDQRVQRARLGLVRLHLGPKQLRLSQSVTVRGSSTTHEPASGIKR
jgi:hypothetical protein